MRPLRVAPDDVLPITLYHQSALHLWLEADADRWQWGDDVMGWPLFLAAAAGWWRPFTRASRMAYAVIVETHIGSHEPQQHQCSRRVGPLTQERTDVARYQW